MRHFRASQIGVVLVGEEEEGHIKLCQVKQFREFGSEILAFAAFLLELRQSLIYFKISAKVSFVV